MEEKCQPFCSLIWRMCALGKKCKKYRIVVKKKTKQKSKKSKIGKKKLALKHKPDTGIKIKVKRHLKCKKWKTKNK